MQVRPDPGPFRRAGDDRDVGIARQVHQQLDEDVLQDRIHGRFSLDAHEMSERGARCGENSSLTPSPRSSSRALPAPSTEPRHTAAGTRPCTGSRPRRPHPPATSPTPRPGKRNRVLSDAQVLQILDCGPHLPSVLRRPVVAFRQSRNTGAAAHGDQLDHQMVRAVVLAQGQEPLRQGDRGRLAHARTS